MEILKHRVNTINEIDQNFGAEIDVRDYNGSLVLSHDYPNPQNPQLINFLKNFPKDKLLAVNVKSCGIEKDLFDILKNKQINYFVFDFSIPSLFDAIKNNLTCALRLSEFEKELLDGPKWVWLDSFKSIWYSKDYVRSIKSLGYSISVVSPELHGRSDRKEIEQIKSLIDDDLIDAICTDIPEMWK
jgi:hypothetical protein|tara:strand:+ start:1606 stop:2163 length:558 start_codon:yes stop_codon:yes gene_type:complete